MAKFVKKENYKTVSYGTEGYMDLQAFSEFSADSRKKGELRLIYNDGTWRLGFSKNLYSSLGEPKSVKVLLTDSLIAFQVVPAGTPGAYEICKGEIIYSADLAEKIKELAASVDFLPNVTTRCGHIEQVQTDEEGSVTVILGFD